MDRSPRWPAEQLHFGFTWLSTTSKQRADLLETVRCCAALDFFITQSLYYLNYYRFLPLCYCGARLSLHVFHFYDW
jgi:hypothetical protein